MATATTSKKRTAKLIITFAAVFGSVTFWVAMANSAAHPASAPAVKVSTSVNGFGFRLLRTLAAHGDENVVISPVSIWLALAMTYNGAAGETRSAMATTLSLPPLNGDDIDRANLDLLATLTKADPSVQMKIANALWTQSGFAINRAFLQRTGKFYDARVASVDYANEPQKAADTINGWVSKNTRKKIQTIISKPDSNTRLILTDAIYFKGRWVFAFDPKQTRPEIFHLPDGDSVTTPMMTQSGRYPYFATDDFQAIRLAYGNTSFAMYIFLPRGLTGLPGFVGSLDEQLWSEWKGRFAEQEGTIILPRFESTYGRRLNDALKRIGMTVAFDGEKADFSQIHRPPPPLFINDVEHKTYVKVDEEGTEAAAATSVGIAATVARLNAPRPFKMVVDHPFFCAIAERQSGALLFAGVVVNPNRR
jgi:serine protease inhibitor